MDGKNHEVLALAYRNAKRKIEKIKEFGITSDMEPAAVDALIVQFAEIKLADPTYKKGRNEAIKGQRWYVEDLVSFSELSPQAQLDREYEDCFGEASAEDEMVAELAKLSA